MSFKWSSMLSVSARFQAYLLRAHDRMPFVSSVLFGFLLLSGIMVTSAERPWKLAGSDFKLEIGDADREYSKGADYQMRHAAYSAHSSNLLQRKSTVVWRVTDFGAVGNGEDLDTGCIQACIDFCASNGGGVVHFPPGAYLTGTIFLKSNITLQIDVGATILGSEHQKDYPGEWERWYVILAENAENVHITGGGVVNGQGLKFVVEFNEQKNIMVSWNTSGSCLGDECRPRLVGFLKCTNVSVSNVYLNEPAYWCLHFVYSNLIIVNNITIYGDFNTPNNDGIDVESSNNTLISGCHIDTGDDAICPKTATGGPLYNLTVTDCWIRTKSCAVKLGSGTFSNLRGLHFEHLKIVDSNRGLGLQLRDAGNISDVSFANIEISTKYYDASWWGQAEPVYITACPRDSTTLVGTITNVSFTNISATSQNGIFLAGSEESSLMDLHFDNVSLKLVSSLPNEGGYHDYRPGCVGLVKHHSSGFFLEYIANITMSFVTLRWPADSTWGLPLEFTSSTVRQLNLTGFQSIFTR